MRIIEGFDAHCGYEFPVAPGRLLPLSSSANFHDFHHSHNVGNYGSFFMFWDTLCGTNNHYWKFLSKKQKET